MEKMAVMLDFGNTLNGICNESIKKVFESLEIYKNKFNLDEVVIFMSSNINKSFMARLLRTIFKNLPEGFSLGTSFCCEGEYDYHSDTLFKDPSIRNYPAKMDTLKAKYFTEDYKIVLVIDDQFDLVELLPYKDDRVLALLSPMPLFLAPRYRNNSNPARQLHLTIGEIGIYATLYLIEKYFDSIKDSSYDEILERQRNLKVSFDDELNANLMFTRFYEKITDNMLINSGLNQEDIDEFNIIYKFFKEADNVPKDISEYMESLKEAIEKEYGTETIKKIYKPTKKSEE